MDKDEIKKIAQLLAGDESGWQSRFATILGISRGYAHNLLTGERPLPGPLLIKMVIVGRERASHYRKRADEIEVMLETLTMKEVAALPPMTDEEYQRQAEEAEAIIEELAFGAVKEEE